MNKVIPFPPARRRAAGLPRTADPTDDAELAIRLWELVMSGDRGGLEYQQLDALISRRKSDPDRRGPFELH